MGKVIPLDPIKRKVSKDICPKCGGELDTGWECNDCGFDAQALATDALRGEKMSDPENKEQTSREKIAKLAAMSDEEFNQFIMHWNFRRICSEPLPITIAPKGSRDND